MSKIYVGQRPPDDIGDCRVVVLTAENEEKALHHVELHSPTGYEWGYGGSGPADLALSILADHFGERPDREALDTGHGLMCWRYHQAFKWDIVSHFPHAGWRLTTEQIAQWVAMYKEKLQALYRDDDDSEEA